VRDEGGPLRGDPLLRRDEHLLLRGGIIPGGLKLGGEVLDLLRLACVVATDAEERVDARRKIGQ